MSYYGNDEAPPAYQAEDPNPLAITSSTGTVAAQRAKPIGYYIYRSTAGGYVVFWSCFNVLVLTTFLAIYEKTKRKYGNPFGVLSSSHFTEILANALGYLEERQ
ncbi:hypothetical protein N7510_001347 [Penicillium lagena]|uniref:uncharacterized protein n=1 Tax=Penicillium lagena TaxID=94218 RepID=UPI0025411D0A|nr:uncharacterized protein N7510_001347 [Penicillium lagena]KAJ5625038.1 hypothetical protein N7510_001347 [Penicillium lagena]